MKQIVQLIKQNKFYSVMSIIGTAITIAYVMVVWMAYIFNNDDIEPEGKRSRTMTTGPVIYYSSDNPKAEDISGMNEWTIEEIFSGLPGIEMISMMNNARAGKYKYIKDNYERVDIYENLVDENVWKQYTYKFLEGRPYTKEEVESGMAVAVITKNAARKLFGTLDNVIGKEIKPEFADKRYKIIGLVEDISPVFTRAFSEVWRPIDLYKNRAGYIPAGPSGRFFVNIVLEKGVSKKEAKEVINESLRKYNLAHKDYVLEFQSFWEWGMEESELFDLLIKCLIFMILPIVNSIGLVSSHMSKRLSEIGVRKAYGASKGQIIRQLIAENLVTTLIGAVFGLILASIALWSARSWMLGREYMWNSYSEVASVPISAFLNIKVLLCAIFFCLILNFLSIFGPARRVSKKAICETIKGEIK